MNASLEDYRRFYAEEIAAVAAVRSPALVRAFASVPREDFLGPGPWKLFGLDSGMGASYRLTEDADPRRLYHNVVVSIDQARHLNNGQPSALASWINALEIAQGDRVFHLGAGVGYYTAIMAEIVGPRGSVTGAEVDAGLAARARQNLAKWKNVEVISGDGTQHDPGPADVIFINAGVTHPLPLWLDRLRPGGRLLYPVTFEGPGFPGGKGCMLLVKREAEVYSARCVNVVMIYSCSSLRDAELNTALTKLVGSGKILGVRSLRREPHQADESCLLHGPDSCLSTKEIASQRATA
ncbi:MAG TPA: rRNA adenine N-6-methyltransferase family protein [Bryobacteraceae bacterium]|nr:rRNA adenine N-6-methyltransferase family protein [Bryobacteraceae bacterium]